MMLSFRSGGTFILSTMRLLKKENPEWIALQKIQKPTEEGEPEMDCASKNPKGYRHNSKDTWGWLDSRQTDMR
jgi:hypothetical protein